MAYKSQLRPGIRPILKSIEMHRDEYWTEQDFDVANDDDKCRERFEEWNQDMWWVLVEKDHRGSSAQSERSGTRAGNGGVQKAPPVVLTANRHGACRATTEGHTPKSGETGRGHRVVH